MKLVAFLTLSEEEEKACQAILLAAGVNKAEEKMANPEVSAAVFERVLSIDLASLIKMAIRYPMINKICESPRFAAHWQELWRQSGLNPSGESHKSELATHEYEPMPTVSCFNLLAGLYLYKTYRSTYAHVREWTPELRAEAREYLELSASRGCFFAINVLCEQGLKLLKDKVDAEMAAHILELAQKAADLYWTPGYLLLASVNQELSLHTEVLLKDKRVLPKKILFREALVALKVAQKLEGDSQAMINNGYQGQTIEQASNGQFRTWFGAVVMLKSKSNGFLSDMMERDAEIEAREIALSVKSKYLKTDKVDKEKSRLQSLDDFIDCSEDLETKHSPRASYF